MREIPYSTCGLIEIETEDADTDIDTECDDFGVWRSGVQDDADHSYLRTAERRHGQRRRNPNLGDKNPNPNPAP